jgi:hypothetical protein
MWENVHDIGPAIAAKNAVNRETDSLAWGEPLRNDAAAKNTWCATDDFTKESAMTLAIWYAGSWQRTCAAKWRKRRERLMGKRILFVSTALALVAGALAAGYWYRAKHVEARPALASATGLETAPAGRNPVERASPPAELPAENAVPAPSPVVKKDAEAPWWHAGETLEFSASMAKLNNVANLRIQTGERRDFLGKSVWHLQAVAHTENPLRMMFVLDDQFDSYSDAASMTSVQYEMHLNERGQKVDTVERMTTTGREVPPPNVTEARVVPGTRDPLGMLQYLRSVEWSKTPEVRSWVYDGRKLYEVRARQSSAGETVSVPAGNFHAAKIAIRVFDNGVEMKDALFALYLANTAARTPVLIEAVLPIATVRVELVKASGR